MEIDPNIIDHYFKIFVLSAAAFVGSYAIVKLFKYVVYLALVLVCISAAVFFAESFTDIDVSNIDIRSVWTYLSGWFFIIVKFFLDILNNGGMMVVVGMILGGIVGLKK